MRWTTEESGLDSGKGRTYSFSHSVQASFETPPPPDCVPMVTWGSFLQFNWNRDFFPGVKRPEREVNYSSPSNPEVKNGWSNTSSSPKCLHGVDREIFTFAFFSGYVPEDQVAEASR